MVRDCLDQSLFSALLSLRREPAWQTRARERAWASYRQMAWPTINEELWRRTNISHLNLEDYTLALPAALPACAYRDLDGYSGRAVFRGQACQELQLTPALATRGVVWTTLADAMERFPDLVARYSQLPAPIYGKLDAMHAAMWTHGMFLYVPKGVEIAAPFAVSFAEIGDRHASFPRLVVALAAGARARLVHDIRSMAAGEEVAVNASSSIMLDESSALHYIALQQLNQKSFYYSHEYADVGRDAELSVFGAAFGSALAKNFFETTLARPGAQMKMRSIYFAENDQHFDMRAVQYHQASHTQTDVLSKGAVKDQARAVQQGLIQVAPQAQKIDAYQANKNLVLSHSARVDSLPGLEINANDLKCTHGVTVGKVSEREVFYLTSRGLTRCEAQKMIVCGFFDEILNGLPENVAEECRSVVEYKVESLKE